MTNRLFEKGREGFLDGTCDWDTHTFRVALVDTGTIDKRLFCRADVHAGGVCAAAAFVG